MKVKELIEQLRSSHDEDDSLIVAYWGRDEIHWADSEDEPRPEGTYIPKEDWPAFADHINRKMDWSDYAEIIEWMWKNYKKERQVIPSFTWSIDRERN